MSKAAEAGKVNLTMLYRHVYHALLAALAFAAPLVGLFETLRNKSERFLRPEGKRNYAKHPEFRSQASAQDQQ